MLCEYKESRTGSGTKANLWKKKIINRLQLQYTYYIYIYMIYIHNNNISIYTNYARLDNLSSIMISIYDSIGT